MPTFELQKVIVLLLILTVSKAPLPCVHSHEGLGDEQLQFHFAIHHAEVSESVLPSGWHWHLLWPGLPQRTAQNDFTVGCFGINNQLDDQYPLPFEMDSIVSLTSPRDHQARRALRECSQHTNTSSPLVLAAHLSNPHRCVSPASDDCRYQRFCALLL